MKKIIIILAAFTTVLGLGSCKDSFLDITNTSKISTSVYPTSMENMEQVVNTLYSMENQYNLYGSDLLVRTALVNDHSLDFRHNNTAEWNQIGTHQIQPSNAYIYQDWQGFYRMIGAANTVLEEADKFASKYTLNATQKARIDQMLGEAYFWRAWAHINLCCFFGEGYPCNGDGSKKGIPILTTVTSSYADARKPRNTVDEVYAQVIKDYKEAMNRLPKAWSSKADYPRPTYYAAESFLGQAYLFQGDYSNCITALKDVINNSGKKLVDFEHYSHMFNADQVKFNDESILEINNYSSTLGTGTLHARWISLCYINAAGKTVGTGWDNLFFHDSNITRYGDDPRLHVVALEPGTPITIDGFTTVVSKYKNLEASYKGWADRKYCELTTSIGKLAGAPYSGINIHLMRLADVYLMCAEACQSSGDEASARSYANVVRRRAYQDNNHDITSSGTTLRDDIREERFKELCAEGVQHWQDVCRWKTLDQEIKKWYPITRSGAPVYSAKALYFPIPQSEMENNPNMVQNDGY